MVAQNYIYKAQNISLKDNKPTSHSIQFSLVVTNNKTYIYIYVWKHTTQNFLWCPNNVVYIIVILYNLNEYFMTIQMYISKKNIISIKSYKRAFKSFSCFFIHVVVICCIMHLCFVSSYFQNYLSIIKILF